MNSRWTSALLVLGLAAACGDGSGTGLSIVRALVRDELRGALALENDGGLRAEVAFPA